MSQVHPLYDVLSRRGLNPARKLACYGVRPFLYYWRVTVASILSSPTHGVGLGGWLRSETDYPA